MVVTIIKFFLFGDKVRSSNITEHKTFYSVILLFHGFDASSGEYHLAHDDDFIAILSRYMSSIG